MPWIAQYAVILRLCVVEWALVLITPFRLVRWDSFAGTTNQDTNSDSLPMIHISSRHKFVTTAWLSGCFISQALPPVSLEGLTEDVAGRQGHESVS
jgi:hypothetical protein